MSTAFEIYFSPPTKKTSKPPKKVLQYDRRAQTIEELERKQQLAEQRRKVHLYIIIMLHFGLKAFIEARLKCIKEQDEAMSQLMATLTELLKKQDSISQ